MVWEIGRKPVTRNFEDFSNIARARVDATLHVDRATGQIRVTDRENPFQRVVTWVRDNLHLRPQPPTAQAGTEEVRGAYNRFLQAVAAEHRYQEQLPWLEDTLAPELMVADPKPLTTRKIRDLTARLEELARDGAETRVAADYFSGREGSNCLNNMLEEGIEGRPALEHAGFRLSGAEADKLSGAIHDEIMAAFRTNQQEVSRQQADGIAARLVDATLAEHETRLLAAHPPSGAATAGAQGTSDVPDETTALPGNKENGAGDDAPGIDHKAASMLTAAHAPDTTQPAPRDVTPEATSRREPQAGVSEPLRRSFVRKTIKQLWGRRKTFTAPAQQAPGTGSTNASTAARTPDITQPVNKDVAPEEASRREPQAGVSEPLRRSFVRRTIKQLRGRRKTFTAPARQAPGGRTETGPAATGAAERSAGEVEGKYRERSVDVPPTPAGPEQTDESGAIRRRSIRLGRGSARRSSKLAGSVRPSRKDDGKKGVAVDKQRLSDYLKDIELPRDVRAAVKILVKDGSIRNYGELFEAVNKATFEWACKNRMLTWYGEALKGQGIPKPRGSNRELPADLLAQVRTNVVSDREVLDYPGFKRQVRSMIGKYVLGQSL